MLYWVVSPCCWCFYFGFVCTYVCGGFVQWERLWVWVQGCENNCSGLLWIYILLSNVPFIPAIISCAFLIFFSFFFGIFICDSSCYLEFLLCMVIELAVNFQDNTVREDIEFHKKKKKSIWKKKNCKILFSANFNSAVGSYRKEAGCIVTLTSWCNLPWSCSHNYHCLKFLRDPLNFYFRFVLGIIHSTFLEVGKTHFIYFIILSMDCLL